MAPVGSAPILAVRRLNCGRGKEAGPVADRQRAGRDADADAAGACGRRRLRRGDGASSGTRPVADRHRAGRDADADAAGACGRRRLRRVGPGQLPLGAGTVGMRTRMPPVRVDGVGSVEGGTSFGAVPLRAPGPFRLPLGAGLVAMRTRMPAGRVPLRVPMPGRLPLGAGPVAMRTRMPPGRVDGVGFGAGAAGGAVPLPGPLPIKRRAGRNADADGEGRTADVVGHAPSGPPPRASAEFALAARPRNTAPDDPRDSP